MNIQGKNTSIQNQLSSQEQHKNSGRPNKKQLQQADDYHKLKEYYYDRYMNQLRDKIIQLDNVPTAAPTTGSRKPTNPQSGSARLSGKGSSSGKTRKSGSSSSSHKPVSSTSKSRRLTMLEVEQRLTKAGFLESPQELTEFRNGIAAADDLEKYADEFVEKKSQLKQRLASSGKRGRPLSRIVETRDNSARNSRPTSKSIPKKQMDTNLNPLGGKKNISPAEIARAAAAALEKRCPRMDVPDLHCLRPESDDSDGESEIIQDELRGARRDEYASYISNLRRMYQRAQANTAQARRIINDRDDDILQHDRKTQLISDLTDLCTTISPTVQLRQDGEGNEMEEFGEMGSSAAYDPAFDVPDLSDTEGDDFSEIQEARVTQWRQESQQPSTAPRRSLFSRFTPIEEEPGSPHLQILEHRVPQSGGELVSVNDGDSRVEKVLAIESGDIERITHPLNLEYVQSELRTMESKAMSTYWPNYLKVGTSKFAREVSNL